MSSGSFPELNPCTCGTDKPPERIATPFGHIMFYCPNCRKETSLCDYDEAFDQWNEMNPNGVNENAEI